MPSNQEQRTAEQREELLARREVMRELKALGGISEKAFDCGEAAFARLLAKLDARSVHAVTAPSKKPDTKTVVCLLLLCLGVTALNGMIEGHRIVFMTAGCLPWSSGS